MECTDYAGSVNCGSHGTTEMQGLKESQRKGNKWHEGSKKSIQRCARLRLFLTDRRSRPHLGLPPPRMCTGRRGSAVARYTAHSWWNAGAERTERGRSSMHEAAREWVVGNAKWAEELWSFRKMKTTYPRRSRTGKDRTLHAGSNSVLVELHQQQQPADDVHQPYGAEEERLPRRGGGGEAAEHTGLESSIESKPRARSASASRRTRNCLNGPLTLTSADYEPSYRGWKRRGAWTAQNARTRTVGRRAGQVDRTQAERRSTGQGRVSCWRVRKVDSRQDVVHEKTKKAFQNRFDRHVPSDVLMGLGMMLSRKRLGNVSMNFPTTESFSMVPSSPVVFSEASPEHEIEQAPFKF
ncbi:hypothetical protein C8R44DRAFT_750812 [Mycena epipterygia]|nr:hypothetical protein C8R44DRAFT_750812 [Mycena epipterygia]